jgi:hypothetical protein
MLESHTNLLKTSLTTLQSELTSLKPLLNTRAPAVASPSPIPGAGADVKARFPFASGSNGAAPQLPSWQLAAMNAGVKTGAKELAKEDAKAEGDEKKEAA